MLGLLHVQPATTKTWQLVADQPQAVHNASGVLLQDSRGRHLNTQQ